MLNTYVSIRFFSSIIKKGDRVQIVLDAVLFAIYLALAFNLNNRIFFTFWALLIYIVAAAKYALLLGTVPHPRLLKRKILVDISGIMMCALALIGILTGHGTLSLWLMAVVFFIANILFFFVWPLYKSDEL